jgi:carbonic anhydrase
VTEPTAGHRSTSEYGRLLAENQRYTEAFDRSALTAAPLSGLIILTCMDARLDVEEALGLRTGDAHVIRNAGGLATDDAIRSIAVSQHLLGTDEIVVIEHTGCALHGADADALRDRFSRSLGLDLAAIEPQPDLGQFADLEANLRAQVERIRTHPLLRPVPVHGLIFDVANGRLTEVL